MTAKLLSDRVKKVAPSDVSADRYEFISLKETEPDLGVPASSGYILSSTDQGVRSWISTDDATGITKDGNNSVFSGTISHQGLIPTEGTNIDQIKTFTLSLTLTGDWIDTGIKNTNLVNGTYILQLFANDSGVTGGQNIEEYYSGLLSWYAGTTTTDGLSGNTDEIPLHRAGGSLTGKIFLRTMRTTSADNLKLQLYSSTITAEASNYIFKFRRVI